MNSPSHRQLFATTGDYRFAAGEAALGQRTAAQLAEEKDASAAEEEEGGVCAPCGAADAAPASGGGRRRSLDLELEDFEAPTEEAGGREEEAGEEEEGEEEGEATCYIYGDLRIPFCVEEGWLRVRDPSHSQNWLLIGYARGDADRIEVVGQGGGGLGECLAALAAAPGRMLWGGFRATAVDTRRGIVSERPKYIEIAAYLVSRRGWLMTAGTLLIGTSSSRTPTPTPAFARRLADCSTSARSPRCCSARTSPLRPTTRRRSHRPRWRRSCWRAAAPTSQTHTTLAAGSSCARSGTELDFDISFVL